MPPPPPPTPLKEVLAGLEQAHLELARRYPGESRQRQPVHTVYGGAHIFRSDTAPRLGRLALAMLREYAEDFTVFASVLAFPGAERLAGQQASELSGEMGQDPEARSAIDPDARLALTVYNRVVAKLEAEPVEDFRIDFEDGYGYRADEEEDRHAREAASATAQAMAAGTLPPFIGIRVKPLNEELKHRSARTLDLFLSTLVEATGGKLPDNFVVTLPKVTIPEEVSAFVKLLEFAERKCHLPAGSLRLELMVETAQALIDRSGTCTLPVLLEAAAGRCRGVHFGPYDYTASLGITAAQQALDHPACDFARQTIMLALAGTGTWISDGPVNILPVAPHHRAPGGPPLTAKEKRENRQAVHRAWRCAYEQVMRALEQGYYQGWDLHPGQLPIRYAACHLFFLHGLASASQRLEALIDKAVQAGRVGEVFDDAATGQGLINHFLRALNCGAITEQEVTATGLTVDEIRSRSFVQILNARNR